jgi:protein phosphatase
LVRERNEDTFAICEELGLYLVSDGMGGAHAGDVAAALVAQALPVQLSARMNRLTEPTATDRAEALRMAIIELSQNIYIQSAGDGRVHGMGATIVACWIHERTALLAHMGDSRAYLLRKGALERLTEDHALADVLIQLGRLTKSEAKRHPAKNLLTRFVGMEGEVGPDVGVLALQEGDRVLLCSDGLTNMVADRPIARALWAEPSPGAVCDRLIAEAKASGGEDNVTAVVLDCGGVAANGSEDARVVVRRTVARSVQTIPEPSADSAEEQQGAPTVEGL